MLISPLYFLFLSIQKYVNLRIICNKKFTLSSNKKRTTSRWWWSSSERINNTPLRENFSFPTSIVVVVVADYYNGSAVALN